MAASGNRSHISTIHSSSPWRFPAEIALTTGHTFCSRCCFRSVSVIPSFRLRYTSSSSHLMTGGVFSWHFSTTFRPFSRRELSPLSFSLNSSLNWGSSVMPLGPRVSTKGQNHNAASVPTLGRLFPKKRWLNDRRRARRSSGSIFLARDASINRATTSGCFVS